MNYYYYANGMHTTYMHNICTGLLQINAIR